MPSPFETDSSAGIKRNSSKAIIVRDGKILLTVNSDDQGDFYLLPGGGQKHGETLHQTLKREVLEETGWTVTVKELLLVRDYIGANHEFAQWDADAHQTEFMFEARPVRHLGNPLLQDAWQTGMEWVPINKLDEIKLYPSVLKKILPELLSGTYEGPIYLGDVN
jgi:8-oxo-dGTP pyrophosphatase MutT (NUDIX family)